MSTSQTRIAWLDTETSGLDHMRDRILEIAVVVTDGDLNELDIYEQKIRLSPVDRIAASPRALEVNGYTDAEWADAPLPNADIWNRVAQMTDRAILGGQNVTQFDSKFIAAEMMRFNIRPNWDRRMADVMGDSVRIMHLLDVRHPKGYPTAGLEFVYDALGGPPMVAHRALADVRRAMFVYKYFDDAFRMYTTKLRVFREYYGSDQLAAEAMGRVQERMNDFADGVLEKLKASPTGSFQGEFGGAGFDANGGPVHD